MENFIVVILVCFLFVSCRQFYLSFFDYDKSKKKQETKLQMYLSSNMAQSLLFELDDMHNEPDFVMQCERHSLWKKKVRDYARRVENSKVSSNVVSFRQKC